MTISRKTSIILLALFLCLLLSTEVLASTEIRSGGVSVGPAFIDAFTTQGAETYPFSLWKDPDFTEYNTTFACIDYEYDGNWATLTGNNFTLDEGSSWYYVHEGEAFTPQRIAAGEFEPIIDLDNWINPFGQITFSPLYDYYVGGAESLVWDFYLGVSSLPLDQTHATVERAIFGWVKLRIDFPEILDYPLAGAPLVLVESVVSYDSPGSSSHDNGCT